MLNSSPLPLLRITFPIKLCLKGLVKAVHTVAGGRGRKGNGGEEDEGRRGGKEGSWRGRRERTSKVGIGGRMEQGGKTTTVAPLLLLVHCIQVY